MKKIYYLMCLLPLASLVSACDDEDVEVVQLHYLETPAVSVEGISPEYGYPGDQFTVTGTNFGGGVDFVKVFIGENEAEVLTCSDTQIKAVVPDDATTGWISVQYMGQEVPSDLMYRVMGKPSVEMMKPVFGEGTDMFVWAFAGGEVTFLGAELGGSEDDIDVRFGKSSVSAEIVSWSENEFTVKVPEDATSGDIALTIGSQQVNVPGDTQGKEVFRLVQHAEVSKVTPAQGYKGSEITLSGIGLADATSVTFGGKQGTIESVVRAGEALEGGETATEDMLVVTVPNDLVESEEYSISIATPFETAEGLAEFTVSPDATDFKAGTDGENGLGYVGNRITISGKNMPADTETMQVLFGDKEAEIVSYDVEKGELTVVVPAEAEVGTGKAISLVYAGRTFEVSKQFEVKSAPVIEYSDAAVFAGEKMLIKGIYLDALELDLTFGDEPISSVANDGTQLSFTVPDTYTEKAENVVVRLDYGNDIAPYELKVDVIPNETDITQYVLQNYKSSFEIEGTALKGWSMGDGYDNGNPYYWDEESGEYWLALNGKDKTWRASLYQSSKLPRGKYKFSIVSCGAEPAGSGRNVVLFAVLEGANTVFPELSDNPQPDKFVNVGDVAILGQANIKKDMPNGTQTCIVTLDESVDVTVGFAFMLAPGRYQHISEIKIERIVN